MIMSSNSGELLILLIFKEQLYYYLQAYGKSATVHEFARVCGQPFYPFTCSTTMDQVFLTGVFKGLALTGTTVAP